MQFNPVKVLFNGFVILFKILSAHCDWNMKAFKDCGMACSKKMSHNRFDVKSVTKIYVTHIKIE